MSRFKEIKNVDSVFVSESEIIVIGSPVDGDDDMHNCDQMGCGSCDHVLIRAVYNYIEKGYNPENQEK
jgi:hypothetical protein